MGEMINLKGIYQTKNIGIMNNSKLTLKFKNRLIVKIIIRTNFLTLLHKKAILRL